MTHVLHEHAVVQMKQMRAYVGRECVVMFDHETRCIRCAKCRQSVAPMGNAFMAVGELLSTLVAHHAQCHDLNLRFEGYEYDYT